MKKTFLVVLLAAGVLGLPLFAQESPTGANEALDFSKPTPQFLSFTLGVPLGFVITKDLDDDHRMVGGANVGVGFTPFEKLTIGYEFLSLRYAENATGDTDFKKGNEHLLRVGYSFTDMIGVALSVGSVVGLGAYVDLFQARAKIGISYGLRLRLDYLAHPKDFGDGGIFFTLGTVFGL